MLIYIYINIYMKKKGKIVRITITATRIKNVIYTFYIGIFIPFGGYLIFMTIIQFSQA